MTRQKQTRAVQRALKRVGVPVESEPWLLGRCRWIMSDAGKDGLLFRHGKKFAEAVELANDIIDDTERLIRRPRLIPGPHPDREEFLVLSDKHARDYSAKAWKEAWSKPGAREMSLRTARLLDLIDNVEQMTGKPRFQELASLFTALGWPLKASNLRKMRTKYHRTRSKPELAHCANLDTYDYDAFVEARQKHPRKGP